ncbi:hypothetical protein ASZ90_011957 [hydrocarbon metagenome]|uniref:Uncharacterized protein n=1 Tax=hydrocarbon metagenome TaxID=938273 RepID=A0A0W8FBW1_9ZZZZ
MRCKGLPEADVIYHPRELIRFRDFASLQFRDFAQGQNSHDGMSN